MISLGRAAMASYQSPISALTAGSSLRCPRQVQYGTFARRPKTSIEAASTSERSTSSSAASLLNLRLVTPPLATVPSWTVTAIRSRPMVLSWARLMLPLSTNCGLSDRGAPASVPCATTRIARLRLLMSEAAESSRYL